MTSLTRDRSCSGFTDVFPTKFWDVFTYCRTTILLELSELKAGQRRTGGPSAPMALTQLDNTIYRNTILGVCAILEWNTRWFLPCAVILPDQVTICIPTST